MASSHSVTHLLLVLCFLSFLCVHPSAAAGNDTAATECLAASQGECHDKAASLRLKLIAIATILAASFLGVCLPLFSRSVPALRPDRDFFFIVKAFASGVILATGYMHVLPDSFDNLTSPCLPEDPWAKFPFTAFIAMLSAVFTLMLDSLMLSFYSKNKKAAGAAVTDRDSPDRGVEPASLGNCGHIHGGMPQLDVESKAGQEATLLRNRIIAQASKLQEATLLRNRTN